MSLLVQLEIVTADQVECQLKTYICVTSYYHIIFMSNIYILYLKIYIYFYVIVPSCKIV